MSQVAKSASAFVRAFLAILVLELEDMVVRLVRPPKLAGVHGDRWTVRLGISVARILRKRAELAAAAELAGRDAGGISRSVRRVHRRQIPVRGGGCWNP